MTAEPMHSASLAGAVGLLAGRSLLEDSPLCLNLRGRAEHCDRCARACHSGAISLSPDGLEVDRERCTACGGCVPACPAGALHLSGFSPRRFLESLVEMLVAATPGSSPTRGGGREGAVHLHCTESGDGGGGVVVPCFKVLDARLLAAAGAEGVEVLHLHGLDRCRVCVHGGALRQMARARRALRTWLGEGAPEVLPASARQAGPAAPRRREDQPRLSRRTFLRFAGARALDEAARWLVPAGEDDRLSGLPFFQADPEEVRRAHPYQAQLAQRVERLPWRGGAALPWSPRTLAAPCTACLACARHCPTGALLGAEDRQSRRVSFEPALCTDCGLCEALCPVDAVEARPARRPAEVSAPRTVLMMRRQRECGQCRHPFVPDTPEATLCPVCRNERELDEEWLAMLEG